MSRSRLGVVKGFGIATPSDKGRVVRDGALTLVAPEKAAAHSPAVSES
jgi:hypothetical protein